MLKPLSAVRNIVTIVAFLALIAISGVLYSGSPEQKVKLEQNFFWRNTKIAADYLLGESKEATDESSNQDSQSNNQEFAAPKGKQANEAGLMTKIGSSIQEEWAKGGGAEEKVFTKLSLSKVWQWRKTSSGAEVIFMDKNGEEHKVVLPFKFLAQ